MLIQHIRRLTPAELHLLTIVKYVTLLCWIFWFRGWKVFLPVVEIESGKIDNRISQSNRDIPRLYLKIDDIELLDLASRETFMQILRLWIIISSQNLTQRNHANLFVNN